MGLGVGVGTLARALENNDSDTVQWMRNDFAEINRVLAANGLPAHHEPESLPPIEGRLGRSWDEGLKKGLWLSHMPYSWLHYLRRAVAYARRAPDRFRPILEGEDPTQDAFVDREGDFLESHLIVHSDSEGFYVPIDFPEPLFDDEKGLAGGILGSSQGALRELIRAAPILGIPLKDGDLDYENAEGLSAGGDGGHPLGIERYVWLLLFERFRQSIKYGTAVRFG